MVYPLMLNFICIARWVIRPPHLHLGYRMVLLPPLDGLLRLLLQLSRLLLRGPRQQGLEIHPPRQNQVRGLHSELHLSSSATGRCLTRTGVEHQLPLMFFFPMINSSNISKTPNLLPTTISKNKLYCMFIAVCYLSLSYLYCPFC